MEKGHEPSPAEISFYQRVAADLNRYRGFRWQIPIWTVSFLGGLTVLLNDRIDSLTFAALVVLTYGVLLIAIWQLANCQRSLEDNRRMRDAFDATNPGIMELRQSCCGRDNDKNRAERNDLWMPVLWTAFMFAAAVLLCVRAVRCCQVPPEGQLYGLLNAVRLPTHDPIWLLTFTAPVALLAATAYKLGWKRFYLLLIVLAIGAILFFLAFLWIVQFRFF